MPGPALRIGAALSLLVLAATACSDNEQALTAPEPTPMGHTYISTEVTGAPIPGGGPLTLTFADDRISAEAGCNAHSGAVDLRDHLLHVSDLASTLVGCPGDRAGSDAWVDDLLRADPTWQLDQDRLTLTGKGTTVVLTDKKVLQPDRPIRGTEWVVTSLLTPDARISSQTVDQVRPTLTIGADDSLTGFAGCNRITGRAVVTDTAPGTDIAFSAATTRMMCTPEIMEVEQAILAVLDGTARATVDADTLTLRNPDGHGLTLRAG
ncbi:META domain-containing protein [Nocardia jinanensis]|uniref:META domain-containing protein n=1 Tax=Nocardia jinanensis TaxID=382504 RepID=A0A917R755_9NOCA|nr:META domain-containing protein [Nocardia jinanensis]GGK93351.1 META domain-containing protein [Nocardia jinanensis]